MAPTTIKMDTQANAPSPQGLVRLTTFGGTELNLLGGQDSPKPVFIRGASGHFEPQVDLDSEPAKLDIPLQSCFVEKKPQVLAVALETSDELACHSSQCSTEDPNEMPTPALSPRDAPSAAGLLKWESGVPTKGSAGHMIGNCKPCAFVFTEGCGSGVNCEFCHLCEPGEKKRRKRKRKLMRQRELRPNARAPQFQRASQYQGFRCELQHEQHCPQPPPPPMHAWSTDGLYETPAIEYNTFGSRSWQLAKSEARSYAQAHQNPYVPSNEVWYAAYQGW